MWQKKYFEMVEMAYFEKWWIKRNFSEIQLETHKIQNQKTHKIRLGTDTQEHTRFY